MQWKAYGTRGLGEVVNHLHDNAEYFRDQVIETAGFRLLFTDIQGVNICFWYIPKSMRGKEENQSWWKQLSQVYSFNCIHKSS